MPFILIALRPNDDGSFKEEEVKGHGPYATGKEAATAASTLGAELGCKVQPRMKKEVIDWRVKIKAYLVDLRRNYGDQIDFPKSWGVAPVADHFAYLQPGDRGSVNFIASEDHGEKQRFTKMTVGRYLTANYPELTDEVKKRMIASVDPRGSLHFALTPDEVEHVYQNGPGSCMAADAGRVPTDDGGRVHRARMYGGPDLAVAYVEQNGRITARVVCWPDKKQYGRLYGDENRLSTLLKEEGYKYTERFYGARISEVITNVKGVKNGEEPIYHSSYFDNIVGLVVDDDRVIRSGTQDEIARMQKGKSKYGLYAPDTGKGDGRGGIQSIGIWCPLLSTYQSEKNFVDVSDIGGIKGHMIVSRKAADQYTFECAITKKRYSVDDKVQVGAETWCRKAFAELGATCAYTGKNCRKDDLVSARDGLLVAKGSLAAYHKNLDAKEAFAKRIKDRISDFKKAPTDTISLTIDELDEKTAQGIKRYYEVVTGKTCKNMPTFDIDGRNIVLRVSN